MRIDILTLFPEMFKNVFSESIVKRAIDKNFLTLKTHNLRDWAIDDKHRTVDDRPYGGGVGMLLRPEPVFQAVETVKIWKAKKLFKKHRIILLDAGGKLYRQEKALEYSRLEQVILICGHYEGVDYRVHEYLADEVVSIGDYVLTGGEIPAMIITDSITRLIPGVLEKPESTQNESFSYQGQMSKIQSPVLEYPQYTRPEIFRGWQVPEILLSGNHQKIEEWRKKQAIKRTEQNRPDLRVSNSSSAQ